MSQTVIMLAQFGSATCLAVAVALLIPGVRRLPPLVGHMQHRDAAQVLLPAVRRILGSRGPSGRRRRAREREHTIHALHALAAELRAGQPPNLALRNSAGSPAVWPHTVAGIDLGADPAQALAQDAASNDLLVPLAACWQVCATTGSGLATAVDRLAESARVCEDIRTELEAQLAGPRATARMLAGLPAIGLLLGIALGGQPLQWLLGSPAGWACLVLGGLLTGMGLGWTGRLAQQVERDL